MLTRRNAQAQRKPK